MDVASTGLPSIDARALELPVSVGRSPILQNAVEMFLTQGYLVVENVFDPDLIRRVHAHFMDKYRKYFDDRLYDDALDVGHRRTMVTIDLEGPFNTSELYAPPKIFPLLEFLLSKKLILGGLGCVVALPGARVQQIHRDHDNIYDAGFDYPGADVVMAKGPPYAITLGIPLIPLTGLTGSTRFWPGTHLRRVNRLDPNLGPGVDFAMDLGSCYLFDYRVLHCGTENRSDTIRPLLYNIYTRPWFRDAANYSRQLPIHITEAQLLELPVPYQRLFAWAVQERRRMPARIRRNDPCYCGSGRRFKNCHGQLA